MGGRYGNITRVEERRMRMRRRRRKKAQQMDTVFEMFIQNLLVIFIKGFSCAMTFPYGIPFLVCQPPEYHQ